MVTENTIGFIYSEHEKNADKFKIFDRFVDDSKEKIAKAADNLISLHKSDKLDDETRLKLKELESHFYRKLDKVESINKIIRQRKIC